MAGLPTGCSGARTSGTTGRATQDGSGYRGQGEPTPEPQTFRSGHTDVLRHHMAPPAGFEPATPALAELTFRCLRVSVDMPGAQR